MVTATSDKALMDFEEIPYWIQDNLKIITDMGEDVETVELISFFLNKHQWKLWDTILAQWRLGLPVRIIILKARQLGMTTFIEAFYFALTVLYENINGLVAAHDEESTSELFDKTVIFRNFLPASELRPTRRSSKKEIIWDHPHNSRLACMTAGKKRLGRSSTHQLLLCSELAFWTTAKLSLTSVLQGIHPKPMTFVFFESTANGVGGEFHDRWHRAVARTRKQKDLNGFQPLFFSWLEEAGYSMPVPAGFDWEGEVEEVTAPEVMLERLGATQEQLCWRRWKIENDFNGDADVFKQEFPATPDEAFLHSGRRAISPTITTYHRSTCREPEYYHLDRTLETLTGVTRREAEAGDLCWQMWKQFEENHDYIVFGDVMGGQVSDQADEKSDPDYHAGWVLDRVTLEFVALFHGRCDGDLFGEELLKAALYYNHAWATPEANGVGQAPLMVMKRANYHRLYQREGADDSIEVKDSPFVGWKTTGTASGGGNRDLMWDDYIRFCRPDPIDGFVDRITCYSDALVNEEESAVRDVRGRRAARSGSHDDLVMGAAGCIALHIRCPRTRNVRIQPVNRGSHVQSDAELATAGVRDYGLDVLEDEDNEMTF